MVFGGIDMFEGYVEGSLASDEKIKVRAKYHWIAWLESMFFILMLGGAAIVCWFVAFQMYVDNENIWR